MVYYDKNYENTGRTWDLECPICNAQWDWDGEPLYEGSPYEDQCPKCESYISITASYTVDYEVEAKTSRGELK